MNKTSLLVESLTLMTGQCWRCNSTRQCVNVHDEVIETFAEVFSFLTAWLLCDRDSVMFGVLELFYLIYTSLYVFVYHDNKWSWRHLFIYPAQQIFFQSHDVTILRCSHKIIQVWSLCKPNFNFSILWPVDCFVDFIYLYVF